MRIGCVACYSCFYSFVLQLLSGHINDTLHARPSAVIHSDHHVRISVGVFDTRTQYNTLYNNLLIIDFDFRQYCYVTQVPTNSISVICVCYSGSHFSNCIYQNNSLQEPIK